MPVMGHKRQLYIS